MASIDDVIDMREKLEANLGNISSEQERIAARNQLTALSNELAARYREEAASMAAAVVPTGDDPPPVSVHHHRPTKAHAHCIPCSFRHIVRMFTLGNGSCFRTDVMSSFRGGVRKEGGAEHTLPEKSNAPLLQPGMGLSHAYLRNRAPVLRDVPCG